MFSNGRLFLYQKAKGGSQMTNSKLLKGKIVENGFIQESLAKELGISPKTLNYKLVGKREFKESEITKLKDALHLTKDEIFKIFFA